MIPDRISKITNVTAGRHVCLIVGFSARANILIRFVCLNVKIRTRVGFTRISNVF